MGSLKPILTILPESQKLLWKRLDSTPEFFVLYGGTALALRLGHRQSVDFDFFSSQPFEPLKLAMSVPYLKDQAILEQDRNTLTCEIGTECDAVKVSYFGGLSLRQIEFPDVTEDNGIFVASLIDIFGMKCATVFQRSEPKDYIDIHALLTIGKFNLSDGIAAASAIYGRQYNPLLTLEAVSYFDDMKDAISPAVQADLTRAVKNVSLEKIPTLIATRHIGQSTTQP